MKNIMFKIMFLASLQQGSICLTSESATSSEPTTFIATLASRPETPTTTFASRPESPRTTFASRSNSTQTLTDQCPDEENCFFCNCVNKNDTLAQTMLLLPLSFHKFWNNPEKGLTQAAKERNDFAIDALKQRIRDLELLEDLWR